MRINSPATRKFAYLRAFSGTRIARLSDARKGRDMGASAIGLAIITTILVGMYARTVLDEVLPRMVPETKALLDGLLPSWRSSAG